MYKFTKKYIRYGLTDPNYRKAWLLKTIWLFDLYISI